MSQADSVQEILDGPTHVAKTSSGEPVFTYMALVRESFGEALAPGRLVADADPPYVQWTIADRGELDAADPKVQAFLADLRQKVADARSAMVTLKSAEHGLNAKCRLPRESYNPVAGRLGMKQAEGVSHVWVDEARLKLAIDVLKKTADTVEPLLSPRNVVNDGGELRLIGWGVYRADAPADPAPPPPIHLQYRVEGESAGASILLFWNADASYTDGFRLERRENADGPWIAAARLIPRDVNFSRVAFDGDHHSATYRLSTGGPRGLAFSEPLAVDTARPMSARVVEQGLIPVAETTHEAAAAESTDAGAGPVQQDFDNSVVAEAMAAPPLLPPTPPAPAVRIMRVTTQGGSNLRVGWTLPPAYPPYAERGWTARLQSRSADTADWKPVAAILAEVGYYDDSIADPRDPVSYRVRIERPGELSPWGEWSWAGSHRRSPWAWLALACLLLLVCGLVYLLWPRHQEGAGGTNLASAEKQEKPAAVSPATVNSNSAGVPPVASENHGRAAHATGPAAAGDAGHAAAIPRLNNLPATNPGVVAANAPTDHATGGPPVAVAQNHGQAAHATAPAAAGDAGNVPAVASVNRVPVTNPGAVAANTPTARGTGGPPVAVAKAHGQDAHATAPAAAGVTGNVPAVASLNNVPATNPGVVAANTPIDHATGGPPVAVAQNHGQAAHATAPAAVGVSGDAHSVPNVNNVAATNPGVVGTNTPTDRGTGGSPVAVAKGHGQDARAAVPGTPRVPANDPVGRPEAAFDPINVAYSFKPDREAKNENIGALVPRPGIRGVRVSYDRNARSWLQNQPGRGVALSMGISLYVTPGNAEQLLKRPMRVETFSRYGLRPVLIDNLPQALRVGGESWVDLDVEAGRLPNPSTDSPVNLNWSGSSDVTFLRKATEGLFEVAPQECLVWVAIVPDSTIAANPDWRKNYQFRIVFPGDAHSPRPAPKLEGWFLDYTGSMSRLVMRVQDQPVTGSIEVLDTRSNTVVVQTIPLTLEALK